MSLKNRTHRVALTIRYMTPTVPLSACRDHAVVVLPLKITEVSFSVRLVRRSEGALGRAQALVAPYGGTIRHDERRVLRTSMIGYHVAPPTPVSAQSAAAPALTDSSDEPSRRQLTQSVPADVWRTSSSQTTEVASIPGRRLRRRPIATAPDGAGSVSHVIPRPARQSQPVAAARSPCRECSGACRLRGAGIDK
ncbi:uncharacterized protein PSANT_05884 [Moesziomyces antarcticus]|nr:uncharacterized protein PSANT_05884 [Moesziomyces antarcticus]